MPIRKRADAVERCGAVLLALAVSSPLLAATGCSKSPPPPAIVVTPPDNDAGADAGGGFTFVALGCGSAGKQSAIAVSGSKIGVASLASTTTTQTCTISPLGPVVTSQVQVWNVCYAESKPDGTFSNKVVTSQPYTDPTGVGLSFDSAGNPALAFTGVGAMAAAERCGANDLFLVSSAGGTFGSPSQVSNGSQSAGLIASQAGNCSQGICNKGDVTGLWPSLLFDSKDNPMMAFRDVHYGFANDDFSKSDLEFTQRSGGSYQVLTVDVSRGGGTYSRLALTPSGRPAILHYNGTGGLPGVYLNTDMTSGGFAAQEADGGWGSSQLSSGLAGPQLGFAINAQGLFAAAYYDSANGRLRYIESPDGVTWGAPQIVDVSGSTGFYPSLAFDPDGDPAIAYYRCNGTTGTNCDPAQDGLYLARRKGGAWSAEVVHADPNVTDGLDPALAFASGHPVIAYQVTSYDPIAKVSSATWWIAEGQ